MCPSVSREEIKRVVRSMKDRSRSNNKLNSTIKTSKDKFHRDKDSNYNV